MAHVKDGTALTHFVYWLKNQDVSKLSEVDCSDRLLEYSKSQKNFLEVVSSKLFELMLAHHTETVTSRVIKEAEESGDVLQSVGVAFALENEDENQQYH